MTDEKLLELARKRFDSAMEYWKEQRDEMLDDLQFADPTNPQQWQDEVLRARQNPRDGIRPCLTFDRTNQFVYQVVNDSRQQRPAIKYLPADSNADVKAAEVMQGLAKQIEYQSRASVAYDTGIDSSARCGLGYIRLITETEDEATNQQTLKIKRVPNPLNVLMDPDSTEPDGSDQRYAFVFEDMPRELFKDQYPDCDPAEWSIGSYGEWLTRDSVRIAEYMWIEEEKTSVHVTPDGKRYTEEEYWAAWQTGEEQTAPTELTKATITKRRCMWAKLTCTEVLEKSEFPAEHIPLIPVIGAESFVNGKRKFAGLVRRAKDPQRSYNYERSSFIERVALAPKAPYMAAVEAIAGYETEWQNANTSNKSVLPFNARDGEGNPLPVPSRTDPATIETGWASAAQQSISDLQAAFGMFEANLGKPSNETSGRAILARQREGDTATYHYQDNLNLSIAMVGRIIMEAVPRLMDTRRVVRTLGEDSISKFVTVDPDMNAAYAESQDGMVHINPNMGKYDVFVVAGPSYTTRRQESAEAISQLVNGNPQIMAILGDEWVKMMDWPNADKLSQRFKALLPPEVRAQEQEQAGEAPEVAAVKQEAEQMMQQMAQALEEAQAQMQEMAAKLKKSEEDDEAREKEILIKGYQAETDRLKVIQTQLDPQQIAALAAQLVIQTLQTPDPAPMEMDSEESAFAEPDLPQEIGMETQE